MLLEYTSNVLPTCFLSVVLPDVCLRHYEKPGRQWKMVKSQRVSKLIKQLVGLGPGSFLCAFLCTSVVVSKLVELYPTFLTGLIKNGRLQNSAKGL